MFQTPRGTHDVLPDEAPYWVYIETEARRQARLANYGEIRTPTFETTGVFLRGVGSTTDIVEKEMYSFTDKGGEGITLRPEATAAIMRAYLQHGMSSRPQPVKLFSLINAFRYDKPQQGRVRELHQFNVEAIGEEGALMDVEMVALQWRFYTALGLKELSLQINSIGDPACRPAYMEALVQHFRRHEEGLCRDCRRRLDTNPLRLLDCKNPPCQPILDAAPRGADSLCEACGQHFQEWRAGLSALEIPYAVNSRLVRGLDYYTRSVWEVWPPVEGAQSTIGGGGRYDGLAEQLGGRHTSAVGFATGIERLILNLKAQNLPIPALEALRAYIVYQSAEGKQKALRLAETLRLRGIPIDLSLSPRALGKQLAAADKSGARWAVILGEEELARGAVALKDLRNPGSQRTVPEGELLSFLTSDSETPT